MCMFTIYSHIRSSAGVLMALAISPRSPAPCSTRCDMLKTFPTKICPADIFQNVAISLDSR